MCGAQNKKLCQSVILPAQVGRDVDAQSRVVTRSRTDRSDARAASVRHNGGMAAPELAPRRTFGGIVAVWVVAAVDRASRSACSSPPDCARGLARGRSGRLPRRSRSRSSSGHGRSQGFTGGSRRASLGALLVMGIISLGFGLADRVGCPG